MLEKLITDLKKSLPEPLRKKLGIELDTEENEEELEEEQQDEEATSDGDAEGDTDGEEDKKKKQRSMIIKVIVILGMGYFALDEFVLKAPPEPSVEEMLAKAPAKKKRPKKVEEAPVVEETPATSPEAPPAVVENQEAGAVAETPPEAPPIENVNVLEKTESPVVESPPVGEVVESKPVEAEVEPNIDQLINQVDQDSTAGTMEEIKIPSQTTEKKESSMASKIVEEAVETPPPAYDQLGRGLVYNCKDKFWACVDKPAYVTCNKNMKWNKSKGNSPECVIQAIYNSDEDCAKVQKYNVSTNQTTDFCK